MGVVCVVVSMLSTIANISYCHGNKHTAMVVKITNHNTNYCHDNQHSNGRQNNKSKHKSLPLQPTQQQWSSK
jgi:hypothetical protein